MSCRVPCPLHGQKIRIQHSCNFFGHRDFENSYKIEVTRFRLEKILKITRNKGACSVKVSFDSDKMECRYHCLFQELTLVGEVGKSPTPSKEDFFSLNAFFGLADLIQLIT